MRTRRPGFTIVELLVVMGVIALLAALLLPAIGGAQRRAKKSEETQALRQIGIAWNFYSTSSNDAALPGFIDPAVQNNFDDDATFALTVRFPDGTPVPSTVAATWPWRLARQFDYDPGVLLGRRTLDELQDRLRMNATDLIDAPYNAPGGPFSTETSRAETIALQPAFGYNAYYVGGWFRRQTIPGTPPSVRPRARFSRVTPYGVDGPTGPAGASSFVREQVSHIRRSDLIIFCASTETDFNSSGSRVISRLADNRPGTHLAAPRFVGTREIWRQSVDGARAGRSLIQALAATPDSQWCTIPLARFGNHVATLRTDLSVQLALPGALDDQTLWIDGATNPFRPSHGDE